VLFISDNKYRFFRIFRYEFVKSGLGWLVRQATRRMQ